MLTRKKPYFGKLTNDVERMLDNKSLVTKYQKLRSKNKSKRGAKTYRDDDEGDEGDDDDRKLLVEAMVSHSIETDVLGQPVQGLLSLFKNCLALNVTIRPDFEQIVSTLQVNNSNRNNNKFPKSSITDSMRKAGLLKLSKLVSCRLAEIIAEPFDVPSIQIPFMSLLYCVSAELYFLLDMKEESLDMVNRYFELMTTNSLYSRLSPSCVMRLPSLLDIVMHYNQHDLFYRLLGIVDVSGKKNHFIY